jgi:hypothetical protein
MISTVLMELNPKQGNSKLFYPIAWNDYTTTK